MRCAHLSSATLGCRCRKQVTKSIRRGKEKILLLYNSVQIFTWYICFNCHMAFHFMKIPQFIYPSSNCCTYRLFLNFYDHWRSKCLIHIPWCTRSKGLFIVYLEMGLSIFEFLHTLSSCSPNFLQKIIFFSVVCNFMSF